MRFLCSKKETYKGGGGGKVTSAKKKTKASCAKPEKKRRESSDCGPFVTRSAFFVLLLFGFASTCYGRPDALSSIKDGEVLSSHLAAEEQVEGTTYATYEDLGECSFEETMVACDK